MCAYGVTDGTAPNGGGPYVIAMVYFVPGPRFNIKMVSSYLTSIWATPMLKERRPVGRLFL